MFSFDIRQSAIEVVNLVPEAAPTTITLASDFRPKTIDVTILEGDLAANNTPDEAERIAPTHAALTPPGRAHRTHLPRPFVYGPSIPGRLTAPAACVITPGASTEMLYLMAFPRDNRLRRGGPRHAGLGKMRWCGTCPFRWAWQLPCYADFRTASSTGFAQRNTVQSAVRRKHSSDASEDPSLRSTVLPRTICRR